MEQRTEEWLQYRRMKVGSSDVPVILGLVKWATPLQLWERKLGLAPEQPDNPAMQKGRAMESVARDMYELETGNKAPPVVLEHVQYPWAVASLDGFTDARIVVEIKCPGEETHKLALGGKVPPYYNAQIQHQLFVANSDLAHYWSFYEGKGALVPVKRDDLYIYETIFPAIESFYFKLKNAQAPDPSERDYVTVEDTEVAAALEAWYAAKLEADTATKFADKKRAEVLELVKGNSRVKCNGFSIVQSVRRGAVEYDAIPELQGVDLERYRKSPVKFTTITKGKK